MVSALMKHGPQHLKKVLWDIERWMAENEWNSLDEMRGNMGFQHVPDPAAYERENLRNVFRSRL
jgi:dihydroorotate dehydrogenase (fumarate)